MLRARAFEKAKVLLLKRNEDIICVLTEVVPRTAHCEKGHIT